MKILHTSDWHLGHVLYNYDRREEQEAMLARMAEIVAEEHPDVMIVSGDIFHTAQPSAGVQKLFVDGMLRICMAGGEMPVIITAGNHDSASKIDIHSDLWSHLQVTVRGTLDRDHPQRHIVEIPGKGWVIAMPYCNDRNLPEGFVQGLLDEVAELNTDGLPMVLTAHTAVSGSDFTGHDDVREITVGGIDSYPVEAFGVGYDYLALGHIHRSQTLRGTGGKVRYSGTPLAVSFSEAYPHSVSIVELEHGKRPQVREVEIEQPLPLVSIPTEGTLHWEDALEALKGFEPELQAYVRLNVGVSGDFPLPPQAHQDALEATQGKMCRFSLINPVREETEKGGERRRLTVSEFKAIEPLELARHFGEAIGQPMDEDMVKIFENVVASLKGSENRSEE